METLPILVFENILQFLNGIDRENIILAFNYDSTTISSHIHYKLSMACDVRFQQHMFSNIIRPKKKFIRELDLTGIFWIAENVIIKACATLVNLESLYLLGTKVHLKQNLNLKELVVLEKLKYIAVCVKSGNPLLRNKYCLIMKRDAVESPSEPPESLWDTVYSIEIKVEDNHYVYPITTNNWLTWIRADSTSESVDYNMRHSYTRISYSDFEVDKEELKNFIYGLKDVENLYIEQYDSPQIADIDIRPIQHLTNLTTLHVDVHNAVGNSFLRPVLQSCQNLKKLSIKSYSTSFSFTDLKYAKSSLKDLCIHVPRQIAFNIDKLFHDIMRNKSMHLRRIHVRCNLLIFSEQGIKSTLVHFMKLNLQLEFFWLCTEEIKATMKVITSVFKVFSIHSYQSLRCVNEKEINHFFRGPLLHLRAHKVDVPLQHLDMLTIFYKV